MDLAISQVEKLRSPKRAEVYLEEATKQSATKGNVVSAYRQAYHDLIQAKIYCDQSYYLVAATTAENALVALKGLQSKVHLNEIATLFTEIKEHYPLEMEVMSLEIELMKAQQPYLFE